MMGNNRSFTLGFLMACVLNFSTALQYGREFKISMQKERSTGLVTAEYAILFDCDGVLVETEVSCCAIIILLCKFGC